MSERSRLAVYDQLRTMHKILNDIPNQPDDDFDQNALDAVEGVLYLAEGVFATERETGGIIQFKRRKRT